jgi:tetratricopeptide (TPR) repeat protein
VPVAGVMLGVLLAVAGSDDASRPVLDDAALLREAEQAFRIGTSASTPEAQAVAFRQAAEHYEALRERGCQNAALFRNQGNAYLLAEDLPQAILAFRRGLRLAPGDADLQAGLAQARARVLYPSSESFGRPPVEHWPPALPHPSLGMLLLLTAALYTLGCLGVARWFMLRRRAALVLAGGAFLFASVAAAAVLYTCMERRDAITYPIVIVNEDDVILRKGPGARYEKRSDLKLHRGIEGRLRFERAGWLQVQLAGGEVGWMPRDIVIVDE